MFDPKVREANGVDRQELARMQSLLWPDAPLEELAQELGVFFDGRDAGILPRAMFVSHDDDQKLTGFLEVALRSHADGCDIAHPVGFIEGWFVHERWRNRGVGRELIRAAEDWARRQGCREMASDTWIDHEDSQRAHIALGFEVVDRCVHFRKEL